MSTNTPPVTAVEHLQLAQKALEAAGLPDVELDTDRYGNSELRVPFEDSEEIYVHVVGPSDDSDHTYEVVAGTWSTYGTDEPPSSVDRAIAELSDPELVADLVVAVIARRQRAMADEVAAQEPPVGDEALGESIQIGWALRDWEKRGLLPSGSVEWITASLQKPPVEAVELDESVMSLARRAGWQHQGRVNLDEVLPDRAPITRRAMYASGLIWTVDLTNLTDTELLRSPGFDAAELADLKTQLRAYLAKEGK